MHERDEFIEKEDKEKQVKKKKQYEMKKKVFLQRVMAGEIDIRTLTKKRKKKIKKKKRHDFIRTGKVSKRPVGSAPSLRKKFTAEDGEPNNKKSVKFAADKN